MKVEKESCKKKTGGGLVPCHNSGGITTVVEIYQKGETKKLQAA